MSSSIPPKGADIANEKLLEMGCGTVTSSNNESKSQTSSSTCQSNEFVDSSLTGGMTIGPPIDGKQIN
ncbi:unnamed protein product [Adineta ricciae]|uniref:Uncharacterized protein n=1 Tax=Adineta ricciae TaxID=249248 RepID=A0A815FRS4_ADIRI|nr:unnamed protein product [Adineta ricciae]CAF1511960.1 unnamed protein product [Adineta ricciae]